MSIVSFAAPATTAAAALTTGSLFGSTATPAATTTGGIFGAAPAAPAGLYLTI